MSLAPLSDMRLTPAGRLRWESTGDETARAGSASPADEERMRSIRNAFQVDWREALFTLAAEKTPVQDLPGVRYWQQLAERYLTGLCHVPEDAESFEVEAPSPADCAHWTLTAPPMQGGEYLGEDTLRRIWAHLDEWAHDAATAAGGLAAFLRERAPKWHQVGRVCFHLAENRGDDARPFAFMATYASGFGAAGRLKHLPLRKALEQYAGAKNRAALVKLLSPVQQAAEVCDWVKDLVDSGEVYQPMAWPPERAFRLLQSAPALEKSGLSVRLPNWWRKRPRPQVSVTVGARAPSTLGADAMLDFDVRVALGDAPLSPEELKSLLDGEDGLVLLKGQWVEVDRDKLRQAIEHWGALQRQAEGGKVSFVEGMRLLAGASADLRHEEQAEDERHWVHVAPGDAMREILAGLRQPGALESVPVGDALRGTLRPYQREGLSWLRFLTALGLGACLADDMDLGKTIQVLALLLCDRRDTEGRQGGAPSLLVVPASLLGNWRSEAARFAPSLKLCFLHPAETDRQTLAEIADAPEAHLADADLVVTTYAMLVRRRYRGADRHRDGPARRHRHGRCPGRRRSRRHLRHRPRPGPGGCASAGAQGIGKATEAGASVCRPPSRTSGAAGREGSGRCGVRGEHPEGSVERHPQGEGPSPRPGNAPPPRPRTSLPPRCPSDAPAMRLQASPGERRPLRPLRLENVPPPGRPPTLHHPTSAPPGNGSPGCADGAALPWPNSPHGSACRW